VIQPPPQVVNGYLCFNCADVALAQKDINPAHPPGSPSNPTGTTPNGIDNPNSAGSVQGASRSPNAVVFGGSLSQLNGGGAGVASAPSQSVYQPGAQVSVSA
jgi:hypothetical protein